MADRPAPYLQEFEALENILTRVPHKSQRGIFLNDFEWTCIDVTKEYLVVGTNSNIVCLYDRLTGQVKKLNVKLKGVTITKVKLIALPDQKIAVGTSSGHILIYVLPSELPGGKKTLQVFSIDDLHTAAITSLEWSQNAIKLFSGDKAGTVVCTEINYSESVSKSFLLCRESYEIVQLSYAARTLLISSTFRTVLFVGGQAENIVQVGTKDRKILGVFGAVVMPSREPVLFASRPGLRLWQAGLDGKVTATYIFKDLVTEHAKNVSLLADTTMGLVPRGVESYQFGTLFVYQQSYLLSYHGTELFVIDPVTRAFTSYHTNLGQITDVAICDDEVFILRNVTGRILVRLACKPERRTEVPSHLPVKRDGGSASHLTRQISDVSPVRVFSGTASKMSQSIIGLVKEVGEKIQSVTEGHKATKLPPWGAVTEQEADLECSSQSVAVSMGSPNGSVDSAHEASPSLVSSPAKMSSEQDGAGLDTSQANHSGPLNHKNSPNAEPSPEHHSEPKQDNVTLDNPDPQPVIKLDGDQLLILKVEYDSSGKGHEQDDKMTNRSLEGHASSNSENNRYHDVTAEDAEEELVYFQKTKKSRKKKIKPDASIVKTAGSFDPSGGTVSPECMKSSNSSVFGGSHLHVASGSVINDPHDCNQSEKLLPGEAQSCRSLDPGEEQCIQRGQRTFGIDLEKLKKDDDIDVFGMLREKSATYFDDTKTDDLTEESNGHQFELGSNSVHEDSNDADTTETAARAPLQQFNVEPAGQETGSGAPLQPFNEESFRQETTQQPFNVELVEQETGSGNLLQPFIANPALPSRLDLHLSSPVTTSNSAASQSSSGSSQSTSPDMPDHSNSSLSRKSTSDTEDFYSLYNAQPFSPSSPDKQLVVASSTEAARDHSSADESGCAAAGNPAQLPKQPVAYSWVDFKAPGNISSLSLTNRHIWVVDRKQHVFYSPLSGPGLTWKMLSGSADQIAVSPNGWILWKLHKNVIHVATGTSASKPSVKDWRVIASDVAYISVDDHMAWYVKLNGELRRHKSLSKERPCHHGTPVKCPHKVSQVCCYKGIVWALTTERNIVVRLGTRDDKEEETDWVFLQGEGPCQLVSSFALGDNQTAWILDLVGRVWFTTGITAEKPMGSGYWWQVSMSEYLMQDFKAFYVIKSLIDVPQNLSKLVTADKGGIIRAGRQGVWLCPGSSNVLHACRGSIMGHRWDMCIFSSLVPSTKWLHVCASASLGSEGLIWALQSSGSFFCFPSNYKHSRVIEVQMPKADMTVRTLSASKESVWLLTTAGDVYVRTDITAHCKQGLQWACLSLAQIGDSQFIHLTCGSQTVWAVDNIGMVYMRIGVQAPGTRQLSPAWVIIDGCPKDPSAKFVNVFVGTNDNMVWALDSKNHIYVRRGVTEDLPVGKYWYYISGTDARTLCVSDHAVYALNLKGEVLVRYGISEENADGNYWKKIPGAFSALSVTADDELWAIDKDNLLYKRHVHYLRQQASSDVLCPEGSMDEGWELL